MKAAEVKAWLEAKRDQVNLLLPILAPTLGPARVERKDNTYVLQIGSVEVVPGELEGFWNASGPYGEAWLADLNEAIVKGMPKDIRDEFARRLKE